MMKFAEIKVTIEVADDTTEAELDAMCENLNDIYAEEVIFDALSGALVGDTILHKAFVKGKACIEVGEE
jgi:hypothetical protein